MGQTDEILVVKATSPSEREAGFAIRKEVFVEEQGFPYERDFDGTDDEAIHFLALYGGKPAGVARIRFKDGGKSVKVERVAVRKALRGKGIAGKLMCFVEMADDVRGAAKFILQSQCTVIPFYEKCGYKAEGGEVMDCGVPHRIMSKPNTAQPKAAKAG